MFFHDSDYRCLKHFFVCLQKAVHQCVYGHLPFGDGRQVIVSVINLLIIIDLVFINFGRIFNVLERILVLLVNLRVSPSIPV